MLQDSTANITEISTATTPLKAYVGFDPTAPSLTIGNLVSLTLLIHWQRCGHQPIVLMGGATGRIGDPSGKDAERQLLDLSVIQRNLTHQAKQFERLLDFSGENKAIIVDNFDFYEKMSVLDFLRDVGKMLPVNYMLAKDSVKNRLEGEGMSFTEFSYQLLQGYDFLHLYEKENVLLQMGGSDQWGNILSGVEMVRRRLGKSAYALTCPLLTKSDGKKYGKSEEGNIWLDPNLTSPYKFYQFFINSDDKDMPKLLRVLSLKTEADIIALEAAHTEAPHLRLAQKTLAEELTTRVHSLEALQGVVRTSELLFGRTDKAYLHTLSAADLELISGEIPSFQVAKEPILAGISIVELLVNNAILKSNGEARREIAGNAVSINKEKITTADTLINAVYLLHDRFIMVEIGKKNKVLLVVE